MLKLVVKIKGEIVNEYEFDCPSITIGRDQDSHIVLQKPTISRTHLIIEQHSAGYKLVDNSSYGTMVNKLPVEECRLRQGDIISVFPYTIEIVEIDHKYLADELLDPLKDAPFDPNMCADMLARIMTLDVFRVIDQNNFPPSKSLSAILKHHTKLRSFRKNDIIMRQGDYGNTAFYIISGKVQVLTQNLPMAILGHKETQPKNLFRSLAQLWNNSRLPEIRNLDNYKVDARLGQRVAGENDSRFFLQDISSIFDPKVDNLLASGEFFGEISALGRTPRAVTVIANANVEILEIRWQALRDIRKYDNAIRAHIDSIYRERSLKIHLHTTPLFRRLGDHRLEEVVAKTRFETYGDFNWHTSYNHYAKRGSDYSLESEPVIVREGDYPNGLIMIRSGFARVCKKVSNGHRTYSYLGRGETFGFSELAKNWQKDTIVPYQNSLRAVGYVDILIVPTVLVEKYIFQSLSQEEISRLIVETNHDEETSNSSDNKINQGILEFLVEERFVNGTSTMMIDLDRCTRCDDCVRACAAAHDNNPRFIRHGKTYENIMVANACMHCSDPVCMIGCPTGAIHRNEQGGQIVVNDVTCIGCGTCANSCPYNNIRMVEIRNNNGEIVHDSSSQKTLIKATKCDLCQDQLGGPACERACPHDALKRIDMRDQVNLSSWLDRR